MESKASEEAAWAVRLFVYDYIAEHERPPTYIETAAGLGIAEKQAQAAYEWLGGHHALFLEPGSHAIHMAHPFSGIPTVFRVRANGHAYWANCAWDALGIPAALHADAQIEAQLADSQASVTLTVAADRVHGHDELVHLSVPFRHWYDDLIFT